MIFFLTMRTTTKMRNHHLLWILSPFLSVYIFFFFFFFGSFHGVHSACSNICDPASSSSWCGGIRIHYPFWVVSDAAVHCGYPGFGLNCSADYDYPILSLLDNPYFVTKINYFNKTLTAVDIDNNVDQDSPICPRPRHNVTMGSLPFDYNYFDVNLFFFFNCSGLPPKSSPLVAIDCLRFGDKQSYVFVNESQENTAAVDEILDCEEMVVAAVKRTGLTPAKVVEFASAIRRGFSLSWKTPKECGRCENSGGLCAFNRPEHVQCVCNDGSIHTDGSLCKGRKEQGCAHVLNPPDLHTRKHRNLRKKAIIVGLGAGIGITLILLVAFKKKSPIKRILALVKQRSEYFDSEIKIERLVFSRRYTYKDIKRMTNSFKEKLGQGGHGFVYKGKLRDGQLVAVKLLKELNGDAEEFFNEVATISRTSHVNVVSLLGFCLEGSKRALIYEFMPNGSLEKFIFNESNNTSEVDQHLSWEMLYQISLGIAHGLEYLHRGCNIKILHFDIKPHNILLDGNYCPKISDFGLAKICPREASTVSVPGARGTIGYIAPELLMRDIGGISHKSDVYSYGMMVLKMLGRRKKIEVADCTSEVCFPHWVHQCLELQEEIGLRGITNEEEEGIAKRMSVIGLWCIQVDPGVRPSMTQVVEMLKGSIEALQIPPKPSLSSSLLWLAA